MGTGAGSVLFLSPHADDVCFSLAGLCSRTVLPKHLLTVFSSSEWVYPGWAGPRGRASVSAVRRAEDQSFCAALGLVYHAAGLFDSSVRHGRRWGLREPTGDEDVLEASVERVLERLLDECGCDVIVGPLGLGGHTDHVVCARAARKVAIRHGVAAVYYEDLPYASELGLERIAAGLSVLDPSLRPFGCTGSMLVCAKLTLAGIYASQSDPAVTAGVLAHNARLAPDPRHPMRAPVTERVWAADEAALLRMTGLEAEERACAAAVTSTR